MYKSVVAGYLRSEGRGLVFVGILFLLVLAAPSLGGLIDRYVPTARWLEVRSVKVEDAMAGDDPIMHVDRAINTTFHGEYVAIIKRKGIAGFSYFCSGIGGSDYRPDAVLPDPLHLSWWVYPSRCDLPPGRYLVDTLWRIDTPSGVTREVRNRSNIFTIHPAASGK